MVSCIFNFGLLLAHLCYCSPGSESVASSSASHENREDHYSAPLCFLVFTEEKVSAASDNIVRAESVEGRPHLGTFGSLVSVCSELLGCSRMPMWSTSAHDMTFVREAMRVRRGQTS